MGILGLAQGFVALAVTFLPAEPNATLAWWLFAGAVVCVVAMVILLVWPQKTEEPTNPSSVNVGRAEASNIGISYNQQGGITTGQLTIGQQPRKVSEADANALVEELRKYPAEQCSISVATNVWDGEQLAYRLADILDSAGWSVSFGSLNTRLNFRAVGVNVVASPQNTQARILIDWLEEVGLNPTRDFNENAEHIEIGVGASS